MRGDEPEGVIARVAARVMLPQSSSLDYPSVDHRKGWNHHTSVERNRHRHLNNIAHGAAWRPNEPYGRPCALVIPPSRLGGQFPEARRLLPGQLAQPLGFGREYRRGQAHLGPPGATFLQGWMNRGMTTKGWGPRDPDPFFLLSSARRHRTCRSA